VGALTFVAYKHPRAYSKLFPWLCATIIASLLGTAIWNYSTYAATSAILKSGVAGDKIQQAADIIGTVALPSGLALVFIGALLYFAFLLSFPAWLLEDEPPTKRGDGE